MTRRKTAILITDPGARGVFSTAEKTERKVFCEEKSVTRSEYYDADNVGYRPEVVLKLAREKEYKGEQTVRYNGKVYDIYRTYETRDGGIELTCQRSDVNA